MIRTALLVALAALAIVFIVRWRVAASLGVRSESQSTKRPSLLQIAIGFVTDFFDTLGIGSFATTTTVYKLLRVIPDERIVGTLLVGHSLPVVVQAFIFLVVVRVDPVVLAALIAVSVVGSWLGAGVVSRLPLRPIQIGMGIGLVAAASFMVMSQLGMLPGAGTVAHAHAGKTDHRARRQLHPRRSAHARHRQLRSIADSVQPLGHGPTSCLSHHDELGRDDGNGGRTSIHEGRSLRYEGRPGIDARRDSRGAHRGTSRAIASH